MSKIKTYFEDYAIAQKACNEFNKKHWVGTIILSLVVGFITGGSLYAAFRIYEKKEEKLMIDAIKKDSEEES